MERDWLIAFDSCPEVTGIGSQRFRLSWRAKRIKRHTPDYFLRVRDGGAVVVDVRRARFLLCAGDGFGREWGVRPWWSRGSAYRDRDRGP